MREQRRTFLCGLAVTLAVLAACGGRQTTASKSAAAYRDAQAKGTAVGGGDSHGHDQGGTSSGPVDHSAHTNTDPHAGMDHGRGADHSVPAGTTDHAAMDHGTTKTADAHAAHRGPVAPAGDAHAQHNTAAPAAGDGHEQHRPASAAVAVDPHAGHGAAQPGAAPARTQPPATSADITAVRPDTTLRSDEFDAPAAISVVEAAKASGGQPDSASVYTCPMHPEVISATPGKCPKCGMTLVKKDSK